MKTNVPTVTVNEVSSMKEAILIDVRTPEEYVGELGHIKGALLLPPGPEFDKFLITTKKDSTIIFICRSGARSERATSVALSLGFKNSYNMEGGMIAWNSKGLPISKG